MTKRAVASVGLALLAWAGTPALASAGDAAVAGARLYEMTENMKLTEQQGFQHRAAKSELMGTADLGTPLCPTALVMAVSPNAKSCTVNATGVDNINLATGLGPFSGTFTIVVQGDNSADSPEFVVMGGSFSGKMDFSPAILLGIPLGHVTGKLILPDRSRVPFKGTFRLPFVLSSLPDGQGGAIPCGPQVPCDQLAFGGAPTPLNPMDRYDLVGSTRPLYLLDDMASIVPVQSSEFAGGWATVKFEIYF